MKPVRRSSLLSLMLIIAAIAGGFVALSQRSDLWASATDAVLLVCLLGSLAAVVLRRGRSQAFWIGFALFGWGYFLISAGPWMPDNFRARLLIDELASQVFSRLVAVPPGAVVGRGGVGVLQGTTRLPDLSQLQTDLSYFIRISHDLATLLVAILAGWVCCWIDQRRQAEQRPTSTIQP